VFAITEGNEMASGNTSNNNLNKSTPTAHAKNNG